MFGSSSTRATVAGFTKANLLHAGWPGKGGRRDAQVVPHSAFTLPQLRPGARYTGCWNEAMRKTNALPTTFLVLASVLFVLAPSLARAQETVDDAEIAAAPDADASPEAIGLPDGGSACAEKLPAAVRLADVQQGGLLLKSIHPGVYVPAPVLDTKVAIHVSGMVARTTVSQRFCNPTGLWVEGVYAFPLPENAAVDAMTLLAGGHVIEGQIKERAEAQQIYE